MRLRDFIVAQQRVTAGITYPRQLDPAEFMKSVHGLAKNNKGLWKSERQGKYLLNIASKIRQLWRSDKKMKVADQWAKNFSPDLSDKVAIGITTSFGPAKKDVTKIRAIGWVVLLDEGGVVAVGKAKVKHPSKTTVVPDTQDWDFVPGSIQTTFKRTEQPTLIVDFFGKRRREEAARLKQVKANQPLIKRIQGLEVYETNDFLQDMVRVLERGLTLTPRQMMVVNKYLPDEDRLDIGLGKYTEWQEDLSRFGVLVQERVVPALTEFYNKIDEEKQREWDEANEDQRRWKRAPEPGDNQEVVSKWWKAWQSGGHSSDYWLDNDLVSVLVDLLKIRVKGIHLQDWLWDLRDRVKRAIKTKGKKLAKKNASAIVDLRLFNKKLAATSPQRIRQFWMDKLKKEGVTAGAISDSIAKMIPMDSIASLIRSWDPSSDGIYQTQPDPTEELNPSREGTSGVPENWEEDPRWKGCPNQYKREMNRCPPGYASNDDGFCLPETNLQRKRRERVNRTKPTRLKNQG